MKVGIITMPLCANYGGTLQNWALQQVLKRLGHEPITLRFPVVYQGMSSSHYWLKVFPKQALLSLSHFIKGGRYEKPLTMSQWKKSVSGMERFVDEHINVTEYLPNLNMDDVRRYDVHALIVGSDQIWRPVKYDAEKYYFLGFAKESNILRIAYAPSIALEGWPYKPEVTAQLRELIKKFAAVSVREKTSVQLIKNNLGVDAQWVLDPTMLLKKEDYLEVCKNVPQKEYPFVFAYILDMTEEKRKMAEQTAEQLGCGVTYLSSNKVKANDTIERWLANFRDAKYIITDSYHGTVFSLLIQKQFYCFFNNYRGNARMESLREISGLDGRFISMAKEQLGDKIDYNKVEERIDTMRKASLDFLTRSLPSSH
jgi:hypothetical protein